MSRVSRLVFAATAALAMMASTAWADPDGRDATTRVNAFAGSLTAYQIMTMPKFSASVNDRIVSVVAPVDGMVVNTKVFFSPNGFTGWTMVAQAWGVTTDTRQIDLPAAATGFYKVQILNGGTAGNVIAGTDRTAAGTPGANVSMGPASTCFGAIGPNCNFDPLPGICIRMLDASLSCRTSVGSEKHDTCCAHFPSGKWCQGYENFASDCSAEWDIAWGDVWGNRLWRRIYDPTWVSYIGSSRVTESAPNAWAEGTANATSYLAPSGTSVRTADATEGFCICGTSYLDTTHPGNSICGGGCSTPPPPPPDDGGGDCPPPPYVCP